MGLVQETSGSSTTTSLTLTFSTATTAGNSVIIAVCGYYGGSVSGITIGGVSGTFTKQATSDGFNVEIWGNLNVSQTSTTVVITTSTTGIIAWAYEVLGPAALDQSIGSFSNTGTALSSGTTSQTIPYDHFIIGMAATLDSSSAVTPTTAGWINETSYSDVIGATVIGGVSGYQLPTSPGTYTYAGTITASAGWGAVTAAFLTPGSNRFQPAWGGYAFIEHSSYTGVSATFTIPSSVPANTDAFISIWVGLANVDQVGIFLDYEASKSGGVNTYPWSWWLPGAGELWDPVTYPTGSGNSLTLSISVSDTYWYMTITNNTLGWTYTEAKSVLGLNRGSVNNDGAGPVEWIYPANTAEIIIEKESTYQTVNYGTITFTDITTTPAISAAPDPLFTVNTNIDQYPGIFNLSNGSFSMIWNNYA
jgi:hypothetical protein